MRDFGPLSDKIMSIPIRADLNVSIYGLPLDLTQAEAAKIAAVIKAFAQLPDTRAAKRRGGLARAAALSPERRSEIARTAAEGRWGEPPSARTALQGDAEGGVNERQRLNQKDPSP